MPGRDILQYVANPSDPIATTILFIFIFLSFKLSIPYRRGLRDRRGNEPPAADDGVVFSAECIVPSATEKPRPSDAAFVVWVVIYVGLSVWQTPIHQARTGAQSTSAPSQHSTASGRLRFSSSIE